MTPNQWANLNAVSRLDVLLAAISNHPTLKIFAFISREKRPILLRRSRKSLIQFLLSSRSILLKSASTKTDQRTRNTNVYLLLYTAFLSVYITSLSIVKIVGEAFIKRINFKRTCFKVNSLFRECM